MIAKYLNPRSLFALQFLSSGAHSACTNEAKSRLLIDGIEIDSSLTPVQELFCRDASIPTCQECGLELCSSVLEYSVLPSGCLSCCESPILIERKEFTRYLHMDASDFPSQFLPLQDAKEIAYAKYGGRIAWLRFAREHWAKCQGHGYKFSVRNRRSRINDSIAERHRILGVDDDEAIKNSIVALEKAPAYKRYVYSGISTVPATRRLL